MGENPSLNGLKALLLIQLSHLTHHCLHGTCCVCDSPLCETIDLLRAGLVATLSSKSADLLAPPAMVAEHLYRPYRRKGIKNTIQITKLINYRIMLRDFSQTTIVFNSSCKGLTQKDNVYQQSVTESCDLVLL